MRRKTLVHGACCEFAIAVYKTVLLYDFYGRGLDGHEPRQIRHVVDLVEHKNAILIVDGQGVVRAVGG